MKARVKTVYVKGKHFVTLEPNGNYHVWIPNCTHAVCDSAYSDLSLAISRCDYLSKEDIKNIYIPAKMDLI